MPCALTQGKISNYRFLSLQRVNWGVDSQEKTFTLKENQLEIMVIASQIHLKMSCLLGNSLDNLLLYLWEMLVPFSRAVVWPAPCDYCAVKF